MKQGNTAELLNPAQREIERVRIVYEEDAVTRRVQTVVKERLHETRIFEQSLALKNKVRELRESEIAALNILEDTAALEEQAQEQRDQLQLVINSMGEGLILMEQGHLITLINTRAEDILGLKREESGGKCLHDIITVWQGVAPLAHKEDFMAKEFADGHTFSATLADGIYFQSAVREKFPVAFVFTPFIEHAKKLAVIVFRDITEEKNLDEARASFVSIASHQLRTPLTAVQWSLELLMGKEVGTLTDMQRQLATDAYEGTGKLVETINLLLSLARVESGSVQIDPTPLAVADLIRATATELAPLAAQKNLTLTAHMPASPIPPIMLDAPMLREVVINIVSNAIRYSNPHGAIEIAFEAGDSAVTVSVKDSGIGIPTSQHSRIFEKFFRADNAVHKTAEGTGLGLNLVKTLIALWHGTIWFTSEEGKGTTFYFTIPYEGMKEKRAGKPLTP
ncbi:MAG: ATP-binding protein [Patescibacteria group bacterium]